MNRMHTIAGLAALLLAATFANAQMIPDNVGQSSKGLPPALLNVHFDPQLDAQIPLDTEFVDETGKPVEGAAVSFHLPEDGPGGLFNNGLRTDVAATDARGRASSRGIQFNRSGGRFQVRIFASKEQARAGMASFQYVAETACAAAKARRHSRKKWIGAIAGVAAGGAVDEPLGGRAGGSGRGGAVCVVCGMPADASRGATPSSAPATHTATTI